jgi:hypothetical protein
MPLFLVLRFSGARLLSTQVRPLPCVHTRFSVPLASVPDSVRGGDGAVRPAGHLPHRLLPAQARQGRRRQREDGTGTHIAVPMGFLSEY